MTDPREELEDERDFVARSLVDLEAELAAGDIDPDDYATLKDRYVARGVALRRAIDEPTPPRQRTRTVAASNHKRGWRTTAVAATVVAIALAAGVFVANNSGQRLPGTTLTGNVAQTGPEAELQTARDDLNNGRYLDAVKAYDDIVRQDPQNPEALAYRGWILRLTGKQANDPSLVDRGLASIRAAETADPNYPDAHFFAGEILLRDKNDGRSVVAEFQAFLADNPPTAMVPEVQGELSAAQALVASGPSPAPTSAAP